MLLRSITAVSVLVAVVICVLCGGFAGLNWLWLLPAGFAGCWLVLMLVAFVFLWIYTGRVDKNVPQEEDDPHYRAAMYLYIEALVMLLRVRIHTRGLEKTPQDGRFLLVCNHQFVADPGIIHHVFRKSQLAFISKKENSSLFAVGGFMHKTLCQTLDREDDRQALRVILKCIQLLKEDKVSVCVFPEGGTNHDELLHAFRPGVFKIAQKANVPIVVCTVQNTRPILHNGLRLKPTDVELHLLEVIPAEELKGRTTVEIADRVHQIMADDLGPSLVAAE
ncbi:MAG: 1-acyl-sn-glycerol-3-phosphate acyltransferase [Oscillospiraceae bacterium]|nr:1-acyl-sn-glycerol-3-phosphate acyltransferase [Oscillospiraceae bacterium]